MASFKNLKARLQGKPEVKSLLQTPKLKKDIVFFRTEVRPT